MMYFCFQVIYELSSGIEKKIPYCHRTHCKMHGIDLRVYSKLLKYVEEKIKATVLLC